MVRTVAHAPDISPLAIWPQWLKAARPCSRHNVADGLHALQENDLHSGHGNLTRSSHVARRDCQNDAAKSVFDCFGDLTKYLAQLVSYLDGFSVDTGQRSRVMQYRTNNASQRGGDQRYGDVRTAKRSPGQ